LHKIEAQLQELCIAQLTQDRFNLTLVQKLDSNRLLEESHYKQLSEKIDRLTDLVIQVHEGNNNIGNKRCKSTQGSRKKRQVPLDNFAADHMEVLNIDENPVRIPDVPAAEVVEVNNLEPPLPPDVPESDTEEVVPAASAQLYALKDLQTVFFCWYKDNLWNYNIPLGDYTTRSELKKLSALVVVMKAFIPSHRRIILLDKPDNTTPANIPAYSSWLIALREVSLIVQDKVIDFCKTMNPNPSKALSRTFCSKAPYSAVYKFLRSIPADAFPNDIVQDNVTKAGNGIFNNVPISQVELWRKRKR